jgi:hypothetical protein
MHRCRQVNLWPNDTFAVQAKKTKPTKGKKVLHLFHDGFTLPSAREPDDDPISNPHGLRSPNEAAEIVVSCSLCFPAKNRLCEFHSN